MKKDVSWIGDQLGTIEEYVPGTGTFAEEGGIYASKIGEKEVDPTKHIVSVKGKILPEIEEGQTVFGEVVALRKSTATVVVSRIEGIKGIIDARASLYVSNIADGYVKSPEDMFGLNDIVKAKVLRIDPAGVELTTKGPYGVVKAFCKRCRGDLARSDKGKDSMACPVCRHKEGRKIADDYGKVEVI